MYKSYARVAILLLLIVSAVGVYFATGIKFDYDFEKFFPIGDDDLEFYLQYRQQFENDNDYLLIALRDPSGVFNSSFLNRVDSLTSILERLPMVDLVRSPTNVKAPIRTPMGWVPIPYLHLEEPSRLKDDSVRIYKQGDLVGQLFSEDGKSLSLVIKHRQSIKKAAADSLIASVQTALHQLALTDAHVAGKARAQPVYLEMIQNEMTMFLSASLVLIVLFLSITYRALWAVLVPLLVVALAGIWVLGFMGFVQKPLDIMMVLLPTIIFVVGMSDVVHILTRYIEELRLGRNKIKALKTSFKEVGIATFLTSLTTGVGFLALMTSTIRPIRDFGIYTALGVLIAYILAFTLLPSVLLFISKPHIVQDISRRRRWQKFLGTCLSWTLRKQTWVLVISALIVALSYLGIQQLRINTFLIDDIPRSDPMRADFIYFDEEFGGSRPFEMAIEVKDPDLTVLDYTVLKEVEKVERFLKQDYGADQLISPLNLVRTTYSAGKGAPNGYNDFPENRQELRKLQRYFKNISRMPEMNRIISSDKTKARFSGRMGDIGSYLTIKKNQQLKNFIEARIDPGIVSFRVTGTSLLIDKNTEYLVENMVAGLAIAFGVVALIAGLMFRSFRMILITLIPNVIPLLMVAGIMGFLGITLKLTTSVIFTVAFGIAVDDTIHFISKFKMEIDKGRSKMYAIKRTYYSTGKAIVITTLILISGFLTLLLSSFGGTFYIGLFVGLTLLFALIVDLTLLPVLILLFYKP